MKMFEIDIGDPELFREQGKQYIFFDKVETNEGLSQFSARSLLLRQGFIESLRFSYTWFSEQNET